MQSASSFDIGEIVSEVLVLRKTSRPLKGVFLAIEKYDGVNTRIEILNSEHQVSVGAFESSNKELNDFLVKDALEYQKLNLGVTYLLFSKNNRLVSYLTLGMGALKIPDKKEFRFRGKRLEDYPKEFPNQFPALLIGKLATDKEEQGKGAAGLLLNFAVKTALEVRAGIGCAFLVTHAYPESIEWYTQKGFKTYLRSWEGRETAPMYFEL